MKAEGDHVNEAKVVNQLMAALNMLYVLPGEVELGEFTVQALKNVPDVDSCSFCIRGVGTVIGDFSKEAEAVVEAMSKISADENDLSVILPADTNHMIFSLQSSERKYGYLFLSAKSNFTKVKPAVSNFINVVAIDLERRWQKTELEKHRDHLEQQVEKRTVDLQNEIDVRKLTEGLLSKTQEISHVGSWSLDLTTNKLAWSEEVYRIFDLDSQKFEATYETFLGAIHPKDRDAVEAAYANSLKDGKGAYENEHRVVRKDSGEIRHVFEKCIHIKDAHGKVVQSIGMVQDITERKLTDDLLKKSEKRYRAFFDESPVPLWEGDFSEVKKYIDALKKIKIKDFRKYFGDRPEKLQELVELVKIIEVNNAAIRLYEAGSKEELLDGLPSIFTEDSYQAFKEGVIAIAHNKTHHQIDEVVKTLKGRERYIHLEWLVVPGYEETMEKVYISTVDITERKQAEEELQKANSLLSSILESPDNIIMFALDRYYNYIGFNQAHVKEMKFIYDADIKIGQHILSYIPNKDDHKQIEENYARVLKGERFSQIQEYGQVNIRQWYQLIFNPILDDSNNVAGFSVFITNITERKRTENELTKHRDHLEELVDERTKELEEKNRELDKSMKVFVGRELKIRALQNEIKSLNEKLKNEF